MTSLQIGDVVWVAFPHVESNKIQSRPALLVSDAKLGPVGSLAWAMMITSADNSAWPGDIPIADHRRLQLPISSKIRTEKIATLDVSRVRFLGKLADTEFSQVRLAMELYCQFQ